MSIPEQVHPKDASFRNSLEQALRWACLFCGVVLVLVWPLADTIAARNIALALGCLTSLAWMYLARPKINLQMALPILCLLAVPAWLWIHYFFLPTDTVAQLYDLKGTWLRVTLAVIMASGLGLMVSQYPKMMLWIWLAMAALAITTLGRYLWDAFQANQWLIGGFRFPFKYKSAVVYFLMYPCLLAYAALHYCLLSQNQAMTGKSVKLGLGFLATTLTAICWIDFVAAQALNGILVAGFMGVMLVITILTQGLRTSKVKSVSYWALLIAVFAVLLTSLTLFWQYDQKYEQKLGNLVGDAKVAVQIDKYPAWRMDPTYQGPRTPNNLLGRPINETTYVRVAWFLKGFQLLRDHPFGAGFSHLAFRYFMLQENPNLALYKTHSGWMDYALGLGLPGLFLTWFAMGLVCFRSLTIVRQGAINNPLALPALWILGGIWVLWWPTEVSEREFIEYLFFMIALLGAAISLQQPEATLTRTGIIKDEAIPSRGFSYRSTIAY